MSAEHEPRDPDGLQRLWTPYRMAYVRGEEDAGRAPAAGGDEPGCPFCAVSRDGTRHSSADDLVVARGATCFAVLNLFPYNPGHLMVLPYRHLADLTDLDDAESAELTAMTRTALEVIRSVSQPHAFNVGLNLGGVAGGSLSAHLHQHVVPRWSGDANFMTVLAGTKTLPQLLGDTRDLLAEAWPTPEPGAAPTDPTAGA